MLLALSCPPNYALKLTGAAGHHAILSLLGSRARSLTLFR
jgi:hypothetical protein